MGVWYDRSANLGESDLTLVTLSTLVLVEDHVEAARFYD